MLLRGAGIIAYSEPHTSNGRADLLIHFGSNVYNKDELLVILEFKFAGKSSEVEEKRAEGKRQVQDRGYEKGYIDGKRKIVSAVLVADDEKRQVVL